jgi:hypothetical protein
VQDSREIAPKLSLKAHRAKTFHTSSLEALASVSFAFPVLDHETEKCKL